ncbi:hypothetical protein NT6N_01290 [Oceaniferula spumae]|uniref:Thioredoxin domain-containing protein n=1 Tax=Oceaniferula spumae TaxID=2979115 RepID=A0AAT9FGJ5_9BACT
MKKLIYLALIIGVIALVRSKELRQKTIRSLEVVKNGVERLVFRGNHAEVRLVDEEDFDRVINEPGRIVVVYFKHELTSVSKVESAELDARLKELPNKVLIAKVRAEQNEALINQLQISVLPTLHIYRNGSLQNEYRAPIDEAEFIEVLGKMIEE